MAARLEPTPNLGIRPNTVEIVMVPGKAYSIRGGAAGRERLRILSRVMSPSTASLFDRVAISEGQLRLDVGCGGGDITLEFASTARSSARTLMRRSSTSLAANQRR
jgi:hypothetical protein